MKSAAIWAVLVANFLSGCQASDTNSHPHESIRSEGDVADVFLPLVANDKHEMLKSCRAFVLEPGEYVMFENGTAYVEAYNMTYNSSFYQLENGMLKVCMPELTENEASDEDDPQKFPAAFMYITAVGLGISILCLLLHLVAFCMVPELRNLPGYNLSSLCLCLLMGYVSFLASHTETVLQSGVPCICFSAAIQFFFMASFFWMSSMAFDVLRSLRKAVGKLRIANRTFSVKRYTFYCVYSIGLPIVFVSATFVLDHVDGIPADYRPMLGQEMCWFNQRKPLLLLFVGPVFFVMGTNILFFATSAYIIYVNRMKTEEAEYRMRLRRNLVMYFRLAVIMGLTWVTGVISSVANTMWLWYVFALLNTLQGFFIFVSFTCTTKVKRYMKEKLGMRTRKVSTQSSSPTFQSYWNAATTTEAAKTEYDAGGFKESFKRRDDNV